MSGATTAAVIGGAAVVGAGATMYAANQASKSQENAARDANNTQLAMFDQTQQNIAPYLDVGNQAASAITNEAGLNTSNPLASALLKPITMDQATLEQTPGYQFQLQQGLESTQNSAAARGLGVSGAAEKAAANYATGLANANYQQQFENAVTNQNNEFNRLYSIVGTGQSSAVGQGQIASNVANSISQNTIGAGNAAAASSIATGNAVNSGINNAMIYNYLNGALQPAAGGSFDSAAYANGLPWSDRRLKKNIRFRFIDKGIPMYEFSYIWDETRKYIGTIAQEVMKHVPEAVVNSDGILKVDYNKAGVAFREISHAH